jgi:hypothetical protein
MTESSTSDTRRPSPKPRDANTATSTPLKPIDWPTEVQLIPVEPVDELRQLRAFRADVATVLGVGSLDHDELRASLDRRVAEHGATHLAVMAAMDTIDHLPCVGLCPGRQVDQPDEWCSFCTAKQVLSDALLAATSTRPGGEWSIDGEWLVGPTGCCTCDGPFEVADAPDHRDGCGIEPLVKLSDLPGLLASSAGVPTAMHVVHRDGELLHAALDVDAARRWAADAEPDGLTLTTLDVQ